MRLSPIKVIAGVAAVVLAIAGLVLATRLREAAVDLLSAPRARPPTTSAQPPSRADATATPSGVRVIPIGVAPASSPTTGRSP